MLLEQAPDSEPRSVSRQKHEHDVEGDDRQLDQPSRPSPDKQTSLRIAFGTRQRRPTGQCGTGHAGGSSRRKARRFSSLGGVLLRGPCVSRRTSKSAATIPRSIPGRNGGAGDRSVAAVPRRTPCRPWHAPVAVIAAGVRCVEVTLGGWDSHVNNHEIQAGRVAVLDPAFASLIRELRQRDLLDRTVRHRLSPRATHAHRASDANQPRHTHRRTDRLAGMVCAICPSRSLGDHAISYAGIRSPRIKSSNVWRLRTR
ncbi:MAG: DUF1501 domain-containing protein [Pirellulaceae bacterium]|nr:DUF1501 domain-containing protein [Pirellulaceae bacterium]